MRLSGQPLQAAAQALGSLGRGAQFGFEAHEDRRLAGWRCGAGGSGRHTQRGQAVWMRHCQDLDISVAKHCGQETKPASPQAASLSELGAMAAFRRKATVKLFAVSQTSMLAHLLIGKELPGISPAAGLGHHFASHSTPLSWQSPMARRGSAAFTAGACGACCISQICTMPFPGEAFPMGFFSLPLG